MVDSASRDGAHRLIEAVGGAADLLVGRSAQLDKERLCYAHLDATSCHSRVRLVHGAGAAIFGTGDLDEERLN
jgi:hypothetical protein